MEFVNVYYTSDLRLTGSRFGGKSSYIVRTIAGILEDELNKYADKFNEKNRLVYSELLRVFALRSNKPSYELGVGEWDTCKRSSRLRADVLNAGLSLFYRAGCKPDFLLGHENGDSVFNKVVRLLLDLSVGKYTKRNRLFEGNVEWCKIKHFFKYYIDNLNFLNNREIGWLYRVNVNVNFLPFKRRVDGVRESSFDCRMRVNPLGLWHLLQKLSKYEVNGHVGLNPILNDIVAEDMTSKLMVGKLREKTTRLEEIVSESDSDDLPVSVIERFVEET